MTHLRRRGTGRRVFLPRPSADLSSCVAPGPFQRCPCIMTRASMRTRLLQVASWAVPMPLSFTMCVVCVRRADAWRLGAYARRWLNVQSYPPRPRRVAHVPRSAPPVSVTDRSRRRVGGPVVGRPDECVCESVSLCGVCHGECVTASRRCKTKMDIYTRADATHQVGRCVRICCEPMALPLARCHGRSRVAIRRVWTFDRAQPRDDPRAAEWAAAQ